MDECIRQICSCLVAQQLVSKCPTKCKCNCWKTVIIVIVSMLALLCFVFFALFFACGHCCSDRWMSWLFLMITISIAIVCLSYLASLLIKRMPDRDRECERQYRMARFILLEMNRCQNQKTGEDIHTTDNDIEKVKASINASAEALIKTIEDFAKFIKDCCNKS